MLSGFDPGGGFASVWVGLGLALLLAGFLVVSRRHYLSLRNIPPRPDAPVPDCMVVIPARNEQDCIARAIKSLPHDTVIVVDDHSGDATAEVARKAGAGVIPAPPLVKGAMGKANACQAGAEVLTSKWILFADADTWFEPDFLNAAVAWADESGVAFLSIHPRIEGETLVEKILGPYGAALFFSSVSAASGAVAFNGQCMLVRREAYQFIGSHRAVMNTLIDDLKLASVAARHRLKFASARAEGLAHVRMREPSRAFRRGAFRFMLVSPWMGIVILIAGTVAALWLPVLIWLLAEREWLVASILSVTPALMMWPWYRNPLQALAAPVAIYWMLPILCGGFFAALNGSHVEWKGREV